MKYVIKKWGLVMDVAAVSILQSQISQRVSGFKHGYFITIDSALTTLNSNITQETLYQFAEKSVKHVCKATNDYCYGRSFQRGEKKLTALCAIEIGVETQRLHAHIIMLHQMHEGECYRTSRQVEDRLKTVCSRELKMSGSNAVLVKPFERKKDWSGYFVKSTKFMFSRYNGFMNINFY